MAIVYPHPTSGTDPENLLLLDFKGEQIWCLREGFLGPGATSGLFLRVHLRAAVTAPPEEGAGQLWTDCVTGRAPDTEEPAGACLRLRVTHTLRV